MLQDTDLVAYLWKCLVDFILSNLLLRPQSSTRKLRLVIQKLGGLCSRNLPAFISIEVLLQYIIITSCCIGKAIVEGTSYIHIQHFQGIRGMVQQNDIVHGKVLT